MEQTPISPATGKDDQPTLYKPEFEHDACGIGALASIKGERSHQILDDALSVLVNLEHRGGVGSSATPVTARAFSSRSPTDSSARRHRSAGISCPQRATTAWRWSFAAR